MRMLRVLLVNDSPLFHQSAKRFFSLDNRIEMVGLAQTEGEAMSCVEQLRPDLLLIDLLMPGVNGFQISARIKSQPHPPRVIIMALDENQEYREAARAAQADGFLDKQELASQFGPLIESLFPMLTTDPLDPDIVAT